MQLLRCSARAMARCPDKHICVGQQHGAVFAENSECHKFNEMVDETLTTNGDFVRAKSDKELAEFICKVKTTCYICAKEGCDGIPVEGQGCKMGIAEWLNRPYKPL